MHVNLTRGLSGSSASAANVMKLNYTSLQHTVAPVEDGELTLPLERPVGVLALHGQLAAVAWAFAVAAPGASLGYVQTEGGALPGGHSRTVARAARARPAGRPSDGRRRIRGRGRGDHDGRARSTTACARSAGMRPCAGRARGSSARRRRSGTAAWPRSTPRTPRSRWAAPTLLVARMSSGDERERHRGISHHTLTVLDLLLEPVTVALPAGMRSPVGVDLRAGLGAVFGGEGSRSPALALDVERPVRITRHDWRRATVDLPGYAASGLPASTMGRTLAEDPLFFGAALAGGTALAELRGGRGHDRSSAAARA